MGSIRQKLYSKRAALLHAMFIYEGDPTYLDTEGKPARMRYRLRDERWRPIAERTWWDHGICLSCYTSAFSCGRCITCGARLSPLATKRWAAEYGPIIPNVAKEIGLKIYTWSGCSPRFHLDPRPKG